MNEFFKYLLPQLMIYFNGDIDQVKEFLPDTVKEVITFSDSKSDD
ncbi:MAG: hypothetical protein R3Y21_05795 [Mycoplasmatota bacterium]